MTDMKMIAEHITTIADGYKLADMVKLYPLAKNVFHDSEKYRHSVAGEVISRFLAEPLDEVVKLITEWEVMGTMASGALFITHLLGKYSRARRYGGSYEESRNLLTMLIPLMLPIPATSKNSRGYLISRCKESEDAELLALLTQQINKK